MKSTAITHLCIEYTPMSMAIKLTIFLCIKKLSLFLLKIQIEVNLMSTHNLSCIAEIVKM